MKSELVHALRWSAFLCAATLPLQAAPPTATPPPAATTPAGKVDADAEMLRLQEGLKSANESLAAEREKWVAALDTWYLGGLDKVLTDRSQHGDLDGVLAVKSERARIVAHEETTAEQAQAMPTVLQTLRGTYNASLKKIADEVVKRTAIARQKHVADLETLQKRVTMAGEIDEALKVKAARDSFLAGPAVAAVSPPAAPTPEATPPASQPPASTAPGKEYLTEITPAHPESPVIVGGRDRIATNAKFKPPVEITVVAKTDKNNLRLGYAADQIIFDWERGMTEFRIDGGPGNGKHKKGAGGIPKDTFVTVRWRVTPQKQSVFVDDELRFEHEGDYSKIDKPVSIFTVSGSTLTVQSLKVQPLPEGTK